MKVFTAAGDEVATLVSGQQDAGNSNVQIDGSRHPGGVYFARLNSGAAKKNDYNDTFKIMPFKQQIAG